MQQKHVPFFANTVDDTHCVQACFKMILKYFMPERDFSYKELDKLTHKVEGKGTWLYPINVELANMGFTIVDIENCDYQKLYEYGEAYLYELYPKSQAEWYIKNSNVLEVKEFIPEYLANIHHEVRLATLKDFETYLNKGYLILTDVNSRALDNESGYVSHCVVIFAQDSHHFYLHDPGLPPRANLKVTKEKLLKSGANNLSAFTTSTHTTAYNT